MGRSMIRLFGSEIVDFCSFFTATALTRYLECENPQPMVLASVDVILESGLG